MTVLMAKKEPRRQGGAAERAGMVAKSLRPSATLLTPPLTNALMMAGEQDLGHRPAAPLRGARVVRVLRRALERLAEGLLQRGVGVAERARKLAQHGVEHDHRGELAAGQHVATDRDLVAAEVVDDPLVEALVAAAQKRQRRLGADIVTGMDELGVLLAGHSRNAYWYGSQLSIEDARRHVSYANATSVPVAAGALAAVVWAISNPRRGIVEPDEIDTLNIYWATMKAMTLAVDALATEIGHAPGHVLVDGNRLPRWSYPATPLVGGDAKSLSIAAASAVQ